MVHSACLVTPGSENRANDHEGSPGNLGDLAVSTIKHRKERRKTNSRMIHGPASRAAGDEQGTRGWYRQAKETKRGEKDGRESEYLIVCAGQRDGQEGSSPSGARMRGAVSESGGNSSLAGERKVWRSLCGARRRKPDTDKADLKPPLR